MSHLPYLSYPAIKNLQSIGISSLGTHQLALGEPLTTSKDRDLAMALLSVQEHSRTTMVLPRVGWETQIPAKNHFHGIVSRFAAGRVITHAEDRLEMAARLDQAAHDTRSFALVAASFKNSGGQYN